MKHCTICISVFIFLQDDQQSFHPDTGMAGISKVSEKNGDIYEEVFSFFHHLSLSYFQNLDRLHWRLTAIRLSCYLKRGGCPHLRQRHAYKLRFLATARHLIIRLGGTRKSIGPRGSTKVGCLLASSSQRKSGKAVNSY